MGSPFICIDLCGELDKTDRRLAINGLPWVCVCYAMMRGELRWRSSGIRACRNSTEAAQDNCTIVLAVMQKCEDGVKPIPGTVS